jgi:type I restriction enzyme, S subunit
MIMVKYDLYKDSGVEWIGEIPSEWIISKLKFQNFIVSSSIDKKEYDDFEKHLIIHYNDVIKNKKIKNNHIKEFGYCTSHQFESFKVKKNDIIITKDSMDIRNICDSSIVVDDLDECVFGYHLYKLTTNINQLDPFYQFYFLNKPSIKEYFLINSNGTTIIGVNKSILENTNILIPPIHEQQQIVQFLDTKTSLIDSLIEKTQKKIELLKEKRTSHINHVVTKGSNPNVEMKDSGVEWIGEIPSHWLISKFKYVSEIVTGNTPSKTNEELYYTDSENGFLWVKPTSLNKGLNYVNESVEHLTDEGKEQTRVIPKDSIMICCIGNTIGKHSISGQELSTNQQINSVVPNDKINPWFCLYYVNVFTRDLLKWSNFVTLPIFTKSDLEDTLFILPPIEEQNEIVSKISEENKLIDTTITKEQKRIELLKEYRQSLISNVVTGKIKVTTDE